MGELLRPPTEEESAMMMSMVEELMKPPTEEEMAEMEQGKESNYSNPICPISNCYLCQAKALLLRCSRLSPRPVLKVCYEDYREMYSLV